MITFRTAQTFAVLAVIELAAGLGALLAGAYYLAGLGAALALVCALISRAEARGVRRFLRSMRRIEAGNARLMRDLRGSNNIRVYEAPTVEELEAIWERDAIVLPESWTQ